MRRRVYAFFGHHRCASSWVCDVVRAVSRELGLRFVTVHHPRLFGYDLARFVREQRIDFVAYTNAQYEYVRDIGGLRAFHVVRDPRDVAVSAYFSHRYSHEINDEWPELAERRRRLEELPKSEGLLAEIAALRWQFDTMRDWDYADERILEVKMEELTADPYGGFLHIFRFLGLVDETRRGRAWRLVRALLIALVVAETRLWGRAVLAPRIERLPAERLLGIVWENEFAAKSGGRPRGDVDPRHHYRRGVPGDWRNHFEPRHVHYFRQNYADVLRALGYGWQEEADRGATAPQAGSVRPDAPRSNGR